MIFPICCGHTSRIRARLNVACQMLRELRRPRWDYLNQQQSRSGTDSKSDILTVVLVTTIQHSSQWKRLKRYGDPMPSLDVSCQSGLGWDRMCSLKGRNRTWKRFKITVERFNMKWK